MSRDPIVAGTDGSPRAELAVDKAGELGSALGAPVHVVCVPGAIYAQEWPARLTAQQIVVDSADRLRGRGIDAQTHLPTGDAALALVAVAESEGAQMIVMGNKGMTGLRRLLGSLPNRVSHQAGCDVLIVPTQSPSLAEYGRGSIVVGTDGSSGATRALQRAILLAKALEGKLHIVSASKPAGASDSGLAAAAAAAADQGVDATTHSSQGDPASALLDVAATTEAAIIVVGNQGMHADEREWFGNVSDKISHKGTSSVLLVFSGETNGGNEAMSGAMAGDAAASGNDAA